MEKAIKREVNQILPINVDIITRVFCFFIAACYVEDFILEEFGMTHDLQQLLGIVLRNWIPTTHISEMYRAYVRIIHKMDIRKRKKAMCYSRFCFRFWTLNYISKEQLYYWLQSEFNNLHSFYFILCYTQQHKVLINNFPFQIQHAELWIVEDLLLNANK
jgi:hypothetical protein